MEKLHTLMEAVELSNAERCPIPTAQSHQIDPFDHDGGELWSDDGFLFDDFNEEVDMASDLDRVAYEAHPIPYRKEASAQEGFNDGFKQYVLRSYNWGLVRGVTSALACLPDGLKEKLVGTLEMREKFHNLYESVHSVSTKDALNFFIDEIMASESEEQSKYSERNSHVAIVPYEIPSCSQLRRYLRELESLLESSDIRVHLAV